MLGVGDPPSAAWYQGLGQQTAAQQMDTVRRYQGDNLYLSYLGLARLASPTSSQEPMKPKPEPPDPEAVRFSKLQLD